LAQKLRCSPKRVSKKYEGSNYNGKQVYLRNNQIDNDLATKAKLQPLEHNFLRTLSETKIIPTRGPLLLPIRSATGEIQMVNQLKFHVLNDASRSMTGGLFNAHTQFQAGRSNASISQNPALSRLRDPQTQNNYLGTNLSSAIQGSGYQLGPMSAEAGSLAPRGSQEQDFEWLAARINAATQLSLPCTGVGDRNSTTPFAAPTSRIILPATQWQQLERTILSRNQSVGLSNNQLTADQVHLEALRRCVTERQPTSLDRLTAPGGRRFIFDYLNDPTARLGVPTAASTTDQLGDSVRMYNMVRNSQQEQVLDNLTMGQSSLSAAPSAHMLYQQLQREQAYIASMQREDPFQMPQLPSNAANRAPTDGGNISYGRTGLAKRDHDDSSTPGHWGDFDSGRKRPRQN
jgi:hypothetical protein